MKLLTVLLTFAAAVTECASSVPPDASFDAGPDATIVIPECNAVDDDLWRWVLECGYYDVCPERLQPEPPTAAEDPCSSERAAGISCSAQLTRLKERDACADIPDIFAWCEGRLEFEDSDGVSSCPPPDPAP